MQMCCKVNIAASVINGSTHVRFNTLQQYIFMFYIGVVTVIEIYLISGLFCMHLVKAFTQLHVRKIPSAYILKRYTHNARYFVEWD
jgi:hypothetical protein